MQMLCIIFPILSLQLMKGSSFEQFLVLKKNMLFYPQAFLKSNGDILKASICPAIRSSVHATVQSCYLLLTTRRNSTKLATSLPFMLSMCESSIIFLCIRLSIIRPFVCHTISSETTGWNSTKLATSLLLMVGVCESNIIFPCICLSIVQPSVRHAISS